ncbi:MAG: hypothetical protein H0X04_00210 [Chthoniobacterales bacterium]|nr:hypothetical protein [Chthoniobacterales bacterium]
MSAKPDAVLKICGVDAKEQENSDWLKVRCPFHKDAEGEEHWHGGVHRDNGAFSCFTCGAKTDVYGMIATLRLKPGMDNADAVKAWVDSVHGVRGHKVSVDALDKQHKALLQSKEFQVLLRKKGVCFEDIEKHKLTLQSDQRIGIPVRDSHGNICNVRQYDIKKLYEGQKYTNVKGCGKNRLYLAENVGKSTDIFITEGELKAIVLGHFGFPVCSPTGGAGNWDSGWNSVFNGLDVVIVYDVDNAGRLGASQVARHLSGIAKSIRDVFLKPVAHIDGGDINDFFYDPKSGDQIRTEDDFRRLVIATEEYVPPARPYELKDDGVVHDVSLSGASEASMAGKRVKTRMIVSAKDTHPQIIPKTATVMCEALEKYCVNCHASVTRFPMFTVPDYSPLILEMIGASKDAQHEVLIKGSGIYPACKKATFKIEENYNVEELRAIPEISVGHSTSESVVRQVFAIGHGVKTNALYEVEGVSLPHPKDSHATILAYRTEPTLDDLDNFTLSRDLTIFQPSEWTLPALLVKLDDIYEDLENNVTRIYQRRDLHLFYDLIWHSALYIPFQGQRVKGWADGLVIGDTGEGKSECSSRLIGHYQCGERVDTKRASVAGIVGGLQETAGRWYTVWGTVPLNDRRLVILEECKGIGTEELAKLTDMRSSGMAEITKIERQKTNARTRLCWISNPRSDRNMSEYNYGVEAVLELFGSLEDIRRFDFAIVVAHGDVPIELVNLSSSNRPHCPHSFTTEDCLHLITWIWSRTEDEIVVEPAAEDRILEVARRMGNEYSTTLPLVSASDQRHKVLRLSTALAGRTYSTDEAGNLVVRVCHVDAVSEFLERLYRNPSMGYHAYCQASKVEASLADPMGVAVEVRSVPNARDTIKAILDAEFITWQDIKDFTDWSDEEAKSFIGTLARKGALKRQSRAYRKTPGFITLLKDLDRENLTNITNSEKKRGSHL